MIDENEAATLRQISQYLQYSSKATAADLEAIFGISYDRARSIIRRARA